MALGFAKFIAVALSLERFSSAFPGHTCRERGSASAKNSVIRIPLVIHQSLHQAYQRCYKGLYD